MRRRFSDCAVTLFGSTSTSPCQLEAERATGQRCIIQSRSEPRDADAPGIVGRRGKHRRVEHDDSLSAQAVAAFPHVEIGHCIGPYIESVLVLRGLSDGEAAGHALIAHRQLDRSAHTPG